MTAATVHLVRHGAPALTGRLLGRTDCPATAQGVAAVRAAVAGLSFTGVASSDLARARACAEAVGPAVAVDPRWRELDFGEWDGLAPADVDVDAFARFWADPDGCPPPGGERWSALVARVGAALAAVADGTLVVTHGGAMRAALAAACGFGVGQAWTFDLPYAARLTLRLWRGAAPTAQIVALMP